MFCCYNSVWIKKSKKELPPRKHSLCTRSRQHHPETRGCSVDNTQDFLLSHCLSFPPSLPPLFLLFKKAVSHPKFNHLNEIHVLNLDSSNHKQDPFPATPLFCIFRTNAGCFLQHCGVYGQLHHKVLAPLRYSNHPQKSQVNINYQESNYFLFTLATTKLKYDLFHCWC